MNVNREDHWPSRVDRAYVLSAPEGSVGAQHVTVGLCVNDSDGNVCDYWLSVRQNDDGTVSVRAWSEPVAKGSEEIVVGNPNPSWF